MTLSDLITALEHAEGPSRELDARIAAAIEPHRFDAPGFTPERPIPAFRLDESESAIRFDKGGIMDLRLFPPVTGSVDEAIALCERVLPGWGWDVASNTDHIKRCLDPELGKPIGKHPHWAAVSNISRMKFEDAATPALALCLATLKALQAKGDA